MDLYTITDSFLAELRPLRFGPPVSHVYNPLEYARAPHGQYLDLYANRPKEIILLEQLLRQSKPKLKVLNP